MGCQAAQDGAARPRPLYNQPGLVPLATSCWSRAKKCAQALIAIGVVAPRPCTARTPGRQDRLVAAGGQVGADLA